MQALKALFALRPYRYAGAMLLCSAPMIVGCAGLEDWHYSRLHQSRAANAWKSVAADCADHPRLADYRAGWKDGYYDVATGGCGDLPPVPPKRYWDGKLAVREGNGPIAAYFQGFQMGAICAEKQGAGLRHLVPTSGSVGLASGPEIPRSDALIAMRDLSNAPSANKERHLDDKAPAPEKLPEDAKRGDDNTNDDSQEPQSNDSDFSNTTTTNSSATDRDEPVAPAATPISPTPELPPSPEDNLLEEGKRDETTGATRVQTTNGSEPMTSQEVVRPSKNSSMWRASSEPRVEPATSEVESAATQVESSVDETAVEDAQVDEAPEMSPSRRQMRAKQPALAQLSKPWSVYPVTKASTANSPVEIVAAALAVRSEKVRLAAAELSSGKNDTHDNQPVVASVQDGEATHSSNHALEKADHDNHKPTRNVTKLARPVFDVKVR